MAAGNALTGAPESDDSIEALYARTSGLMRYLATVRFRVPADEADALVQDVFLAFVRRNVEVRDAQAWLVGAISNASRKYWRTAGREVSLPDECAEWADSGALNAVTGVIDRMTLEATLGRLDDRSREILKRFYLQGESARTIADAFGMTQGTIHVLLHHSRRRAQAIYRELMGART